MTNNEASWITLNHERKKQTNKQTNKETEKETTKNKIKLIDNS